MKRLPLLLAPILLAACGGSSPTAPSSSASLTPGTAATAATIAALSDAQVHVMVAQFTLNAIDALAEAIAASNVSTIYGLPSRSSVIQDRDVLINRFDTSTVQCPGGGTYVRNLRISGVDQASFGTNHLDINGTITYVNCVAYAAGGETITVDGAFTVTANLGQTPSGQQTMRKNGTITWRRQPDNATGQCTADWNVNFFRTSDPRSKAFGSFCRVSVTNPLPSVSHFPAGSREGGTAATNPAPTPTTPAPAPPTPEPSPSPTPEPTPAPSPTPEPAPSTGVSQFDGRYEGTYRGTFGGADTSGGVELRVLNGVITVTAPAQGTGSVNSGGTASFGGTLSAGGVGCTFTGIFQLAASGVTATGSWTCAGMGESGGGTWNALRVN